MTERCTAVHRETWAHCEKQRRHKSKEHTFHHFSGPRKGEVERWTDKEKK